MADLDAYVNAMQQAQAQGLDDVLEALTEGKHRALWLAARHGNAVALRALLAAGADVNWRFPKEVLPTLMATEDDACVKILIEAGADVNRTGPRGVSPLCAAAQKGNNKVVHILIEAGADVNLVSSAFRRTALHHAVTMGDLGTVETLVDAGSKLDVEDYLGHTPLIQATTRGRNELVKVLLAARADVNACTVAGETIMYLAIKEGNDEITEMLLATGADVNLTNAFGKSPLEIALQQKDEAMAERLIDKGACVKGFAGVTEAVCGRMVGTLRKLLASAADVNEVAGLHTPLWHAVTAVTWNPQNSRGTFQKDQANVDIVKLLIESGADVNMQLVGTSILVDAIKTNPKLVPTLIDAGADVNRPTEDNHTPLQTALVERNASTVLQLLSAGADVNRRRNGTTPLLQALHADFCVEPLLQFGASVSLMNKETLLYYAKTWQNLLQLLKFGVEVNPRGSFCGPQRDIAYAAGARVKKKFKKSKKPLDYNWQPDDPTKLQHLCRRSIRGHMMKVSKVNLFYRVARLSLPKKLQQYLLFGMSLEKLEELLAAQLTPASIWHQLPGLTFTV